MVVILAPILLMVVGIPGHLYQSKGPCSTHEGVCLPDCNILHDLANARHQQDGIRRLDRKGR